MSYSRTQQQTACDGVRLLWSRTASNEKVTPASVGFSMDGVVRRVGARRVVEQTPVVQSRRMASARNFVTGVMDGVRVPTLAYR